MPCSQLPLNNYPVPSIGTHIILIGRDFRNYIHCGKNRRIQNRNENLEEMTTKGVLKGESGISSRQLR